MIDVIFVIWVVINVLLFVFVIHEFSLMLLALIAKTPKRPTLKISSHELPNVTIQLPLYNEKYVVERLLTSILALDYPSDKLEIQVLDDSTDETSDIIREFLKKHHQEAHRFRHIQRQKRTGYKAGALAYGTAMTKGEFIAIFDADFVPDPKFLERTLPYFKSKNVGLVQTRWLHLNEYYSLLTMAQSVMLNTHFSVEHLGRTKAQGFINFNGTAGIWRKECIISAGGWQSDTITEDLDLSYRAQTNGWEFAYLFEVGSPAELPITFDAYKTQQFRWSKGAAECVRKNMASLWAATTSTSTKLMGTFHLLNSSVYILAAMIILLSPVVFYSTQLDLITVLYEEYLTQFGSLVLYLLILIFFVGHYKSSSNKVKATFLFIPSVFMYFVMTTGISFYMVRGVIEGYQGKVSPFIRTPKFGSSMRLLERIRLGYDFKKDVGIILPEVIGFCYGIFWLVTAIIEANAVCLLYGLVLSLGFSLALFFKHKTFSWAS